MTLVQSLTSTVNLTFIMTAVFNVRHIVEYPLLGSRMSLR